MGNVKVDEGLEYAQKLSAYSTAMVHIYETNVVTSGELVVEITNTQQGMGNLHSTLPCSAAIVAATLACADNSHHDSKCVLCIAGPLQAGTQSLEATVYTRTIVFHH